MATHTSFCDTELQWTPQDREAQLLSLLMRGSRLTLLYGPPHSGKTTLLHGGLMPLLRRRYSDLTGQAEASAPNVLQFPDRRRPRPGQRREVALLFDSWGDNFRSRLKGRVLDHLSVPAAERALAQSSLKDLLWHAHQQSGARFLFVLDAFEDCLAAPADQADEAAALVDELLDVVEHTRLPAHFLLSLRSDAEPLLARFRARIPGFDNHFLRLPPRHAEPPAAPEPPQVLPQRPWPASEASRPIRTADIYASIEAALARSVAANERSADDFDAVPAVAQPPETSARLPAPSRSEGSSASTAGDGPAPPAPPPRQRWQPWRALQRFRGWDVAATVGLLLLLAWFSEWPSTLQGAPPQRQPADAAAAERADALATLASLPPPAPSGTSQSSFDLLSEATGSTASRVAADLSRWVGPAVGISVRERPLAAGADVLASLRETGQLAIARYDALQAAKDRPAIGAPPLRIVAPLYREELHILVRAAATQQFIHQIEGLRINIGPAPSGRARTAGLLYERLFGKPMTARQTDTQDEGSAMTALLAGSVDAIVLVNAQPSPWLQGLPPATAAALKLLKLDPSAPASNRALRSFLPGTLRAASYPRALMPQDQSTLSMLSFLVAPDGVDAASGERLGQLAQALCAQLNALRGQGHPKWREVRLDLRLDVGWPYAKANEKAFEDCPAGGSVPAGLPADRGSTVITHNRQRSLE